MVDLSNNEIVYSYDRNTVFSEIINVLMRYYGEKTFVDDGDK